MQNQPLIMNPQRIMKNSPQPMRQNINQYQFLPSPGLVANRIPIQRNDRFTNKSPGVQINNQYSNKNSPYGQANINNYGYIPQNNLNFASPSLPGMNSQIPFGMVPPQPIFLGHRLIGPPQPYHPITPYDNPTNNNINFNLQQENVHCIICNADYKLSQKDEHIKKHQKPRQGQTNIKKLVHQYKQVYHQPQTRPIVQPEQYNVQYNPNSYIVEQIVNYSTPQIEPPKAPIPIHRTDLGVDTRDINQNSMVRLANNRSIPQNNHLISVAPQIARLTTQNQNINATNSNLYQADRPTILSNTNTLNQNPSGLLQMPPKIQDSRFSRDSNIVDQPVQPFNKSNELPARQTLQSVRMTDTNLQNQALRMNSKAPTIISEKVQNIEPDHFNQLNYIDNSANKLAATQMRKYNSNDYDKNQISPNNNTLTNSIKQNQIPFQQIINQKNPTVQPVNTIQSVQPVTDASKLPTQFNQSVVHNYQPLPILQESSGNQFDIKRKRLPKSVGGFS